MKSAFSSGWSHASDADYRALLTEFVTAMTACGMVQTADTGQLNIATATRPAISTRSGYLVFRMNDTMQASAPIFIRFEPGTGSNTSSPLMWAGVSTGTDGAGTLTGVFFPLRQITKVTTPIAGSFYSAFCHTEGHFGFGYKFQTSFFCWGLMIARTADASGTPDAVGAKVWCPSTSGTTTNSGYCVSTRFASPVAVGAVSQNGNVSSLVPDQITNSTTARGNQAFLVFGMFPDQLPLPSLLTVINSELPLGTVFTGTFVGTSPRTYIALSRVVDVPCNGNDPGVIYGTAMEWS